MQLHETYVAQLLAIAQNKKLHQSIQSVAAAQEINVGQVQRPYKYLSVSFQIAFELHHRLFINQGCLQQLSCRAVIPLYC